jgi:hypothetical protein
MLLELESLLHKYSRISLCAPWCAMNVIVVIIDKNIHVNIHICLVM